MKYSAYMKVSGKVQGVGYRYYALRNAEYLGLTGYVRNRSDGRVELRVEGEKEMIQRFQKILKEGPRFSSVEKVDLTFDEFQAKYNNFSVEH
jgi:acylphosphatase